MKKTITSFAAVFVLAASAGSQAADYFPLATGNSWNYSFTFLMLDSTNTVPLTMAVVDDTMIGPDSVFGIKMWSDVDTTRDTSGGYFLVRGNSILVLDSLKPPMPYNKVFEHFPVAGERWKNDNGDTMTVVYCGSITVAAGTFDSCYATVDKNGDTVNVFAPNVGMVRIVHVNNSRFELTAYSVHLPNPVVRPVPNISHASKKPGLHPGRYSLLNAQGRFIDIITIGKNGAINRSLARGTYFLIEKEPCLSGVKQAVKVCVTGEKLRLNE
jgi:hypothetical protein